eukprot:TRINITY_DN24931_c0_g1_i3.p1 TRINITY_DN24931_c0_g1~~TRINITY_DN24931_c0_g1_i3.p1  ORF type:complete len:114 (-),score=28.60 TRINITY_DN24931_c0_g1_i3:100-441(-)
MNRLRHNRCIVFFFFLMIRRPPRSTQGVSSAASDVYKRQVSTQSTWERVLLIFNVIGILFTIGVIAGSVFQPYSVSGGAYIFFFGYFNVYICCLLYTSPSPRDLSTSRMPSSA